MRLGKIIAAALSTAGILGAGAAGLGWIIARRLTAPVTGRRFNLEIRAVETDGERQRIVLDRTPDTAASGIYNLFFERGGWAQLAPEIEGRGPGRIARTVTGTSKGLEIQAGDRVSWSGIYYVTPADAGLDAYDVMIDAAAGPCPAWKIDGNSTWAIHIHGLGSTRAGTLRGVQVSTDLGYSSLVVSYRNDGEGPTIGTGRSTLGWNETDDVEVAIRYAIKHGAERIVVFGWSMGGAIAIQLALRPHLTPLIAGLVLDSPVLDWGSVIRANCGRVGLPACAGNLATPWLSRGPLAKTLGLPAPIPLDAMSFTRWAAQLTVPTLILHGTSDDSVPYESSLALAVQRLELVQMHRFTAEHTLSWNSDAERWRATTSDWLRRRVAELKSTIQAPFRPERPG